ncbi:hypothetical protein DITRI_Ditri02bG0107700 [Diplodiscus trichospermus]
MRLKSSINFGDNLTIKKHRGFLKDSFSNEGFFLNKKVELCQLQQIEDTKLLSANVVMDSDKLKTYDAYIRVDLMLKVAEIERDAKEEMRKKVHMIIESVINYFVNRQLTYKFFEKLLPDANILANCHVDLDTTKITAFKTGNTTFGCKEGLCHWYNKYAQTFILKDKDDLKRKYSYEFKSRAP